MQTIDEMYVRTEKMARDSFALLSRLVARVDLFIGTRSNATPHTLSHNVLETHQHELK
jgi:hypothetical protein